MAPKLTAYQRVVSSRQFLCFPPPAPHLYETKPHVHTPNSSNFRNGLNCADFTVGRTLTETRAVCS